LFSWQDLTYFVEFAGMALGVLHQWVAGHIPRCSHYVLTAWATQENSKTGWRCDLQEECLQQGWTTWLVWEAGWHPATIHPTLCLTALSGRQCQERRWYINKKYLIYVSQSKENFCIYNTWQGSHEYGTKCAMWRPRNNTFLFVCLCRM